MKLLALIFVCVIGKYSFSQTKIEKTFYWKSFVFPILVNDNNFNKQKIYIYNANGFPFFNDSSEKFDTLLLNKFNIDSLNWINLKNEVKFCLRVSEIDWFSGVSEKSKKKCRKNNKNIISISPPIFINPDHYVFEIVKFNKYSAITKRYVCKIFFLDEIKVIVEDIIDITIT